MRKTLLKTVGGTLRPTISAPDRLIDVVGFGSNPGNLRARLHVPEGLAERPALVVVLHGCTQTAAAYNHGSGWSRLADRHGFVVLYPEQKRVNNANLCFNWFEPGDVVRGSGEALSIRQMVEEAVVAHGIDRDRVFVTGLSAGGAMTSVMLATYPEVFAGGAIIAGLPYGCAATMQEAFGAMRSRGHGRPDALASLVRNASGHRGRWPTISVWHGSSDTVVNPNNADAIVDQWLPLHGITMTTQLADVVDGYPHQVWSDADGRVAVEAYSITGMGHGTPLDASGADPFGVAGPHMLDVAISSSRRIAESWGLTADVVASVADTDIRPIDESRLAVAASAAPRPRASARRMSDTSADGRGLDIRRIIEDALRAGGLMR